MQWEKVILIAANPSQLQAALQFLALDRIALLAILMEDSSRNLAIGEMQLPVYPFSVLGEELQTSEDTWWLICGWKQRMKETGDIASFMRKRGIPKGRIVNLSYGQALYLHWVANLRYAENHPIHAFATGISYTEVGLDWKEFENVHSGGVSVNLACTSQDLRLGYLTAKHVLERKEKGCVKFVLIGLAPYSLHYESTESFSGLCVPRQYEIALALSEDEICQREAVKKLMNHRMQAWVDSITEESVDRNNESVKDAFPQQYFSVQDLIGAEQEAEEYHRKKFRQETIERNLQILEQYVGLCKAYETDPVVVIWPFSPNLRTAYPREMLVSFRVFLHQVQKRIPFRIVDMFDLPLGYDCFYNMGHLNKKGAALASKELVERLTRP